MTFDDQFTNVNMGPMALLGPPLPSYQVADEALLALATDELAQLVHNLQGRARLVGRELILVHAAVGHILEVIKGRMASPEFFPWVFDQFHYSERHVWRMIYLHRNLDIVTKLVDENPEMSLRGVLAAVQTRLKMDQGKPNRALTEDARARMGEGTLPDMEPGRGAWLNDGDAGDLPMGPGMIDLIVTSPPYGLGLQGVDATSGYEMYLEQAEVWAQEMYRVANDEAGRLCINIPFDTFRDGHKCIFSDWLRLLQRAGWQYQGMHLWDEGNVSKRTAWGSFRRPSAPSPIMPVEGVLVMFKGSWERRALFDYTPEVPSAAWRSWMTKPWRFAGQHHPRHDAVYPIELPKRCILLYSYPGDVILDPFVGVGTTSAAAKGFRRQSYGFDRNPEWIDEAKAMVMNVEWGGLESTLGDQEPDPDEIAEEPNAEPEAA